VRTLDTRSGKPFSYADSEQRVFVAHSLLEIGKIVNHRLTDISSGFESGYSAIEGPSTAPDRVRAPVAMFHGIGSERQMIEPLD